MKAIDISKYFLEKVPNDMIEEYNEGISNLKIQKLLFFAQKYSLAYLGKPFFDDNIQAWEHGPVIQSVYHEFKSFGKEPIVIDIEEKEPLTYEQQLIIDFVTDKYMGDTAWKLRNKSHSERAWKERYIAGNNNDISVEFIKETLNNEAQEIREYVDKLEMMSDISL